MEHSFDIDDVNRRLVVRMNAFRRAWSEKDDAVVGMDSTSSDKNNILNSIFLNKEAIRFHLSKVQFK